MSDTQVNTDEPEFHDDFNETVVGNEQHESMLITTDSFEEFSQELNTNSQNVLNHVIDGIRNPNQDDLNDKSNENDTIKDDINSISTTEALSTPTVTSNSSVIGIEIAATTSNATININDKNTNRIGECDNGNESITNFNHRYHHQLSNTTTETDEESLISKEYVEQSCDYLHDPNWLNKKLHVFILSLAGKPIYSLHGNEDKLATLFGVMQALVSVVQSNQDTIMSIHANGIKFVFLVKSSLILVAACREKISVLQIQLKLSDIYNQILSTLTLSHMTNIFEKRKNFDLRRLLAGSERLIDHLLMNDHKKAITSSNINNNNSGGADENKKISNNPFIFLTHSVRILPLNLSVRDTIISAIQSNCSKNKNLVFAVLIANNKLIALVRMKQYFIHPADLRLIFNLIECSESFKTAESWTPICLPKFNTNGFLYAHVSYLAEDCQACLMLLSVDRNDFYTLSDATKKITKKLRRSNCLKAINDAIDKGINLQTIGIPEIRHFLYKSKSNAQLLCSEITRPYNTIDEFRRLETIYYDVHHRIHSQSRPLKLIYEMHEKEIILAWVTIGYELYVIFEPTVDKNSVITLVNQLLKWIKKEEQQLFILSAPTF